MAIKLSCICGKTLNLKDTLAGKQIRCPRCSEVIKVPQVLSRTPIPRRQPQSPPPTDHWESEEFSDAGEYSPYRNTGNRPRPKRKSRGKHDNDKLYGILLFAAALILSLMTLRTLIEVAMMLTMPAKLNNYQTGYVIGSVGIALLVMALALKCIKLGINKLKY